MIRDRSLAAEGRLSSKDARRNLPTDYRIILSRPTISDPARRFGDQAFAASPLVRRPEPMNARLTLEQTVVGQQPDLVETGHALPSPQRIAQPGKQRLPIGLRQRDHDHARMIVV